ncbi:DUF6457 domain-containing protein [Microbacterium sulfonylureivorans]|uniref:DUF6457 domain-containing protein n=1 Tax=Microbacterium sulfonylureivorans TaxID=2486854 RepID=UPI000FD91488|nr:DUF6457 domain-containing protein [Microbacterium sulfonylureivorans]
MTEQSRTLPPEALDAWAATLRQRFDLADDDVPVAAVLDMTRDVANGVARPAAPLGAFVAGLAAGRAGGDATAVRDALEAVAALAAAWDRP